MKTIRKILLFILMLAWPGAVSVHAQSHLEPTAINPSPAHVASRPFVIDPQYNSLAVKPQADVKPNAVPWIYGNGLARKTGDEASALFWSERAGALGRLLTEKAWDSGASAWKEYLGTPATTSPYPNLLAVLSGLAPSEQYPGIRRQLLDHPVQGTPFMKALELMALSQAGDPDEAMQRIRAYWGEMFDAGAVTFWEDFKQGEKSHLDK